MNPGLRFCFWLKSFLVLAPFVVLLGHREMSRLGAIATLKSLGARWNEDKVFLDGTAVQDADLCCLERLWFVEVLWASGTNIGDEGLENLKNLRHLRALFIHGTRVTDAGLMHLQSLPLRTLTLDGTAVTDAGVMHLAKLTQLEHLNLHDTRVSDSAVAELKNALPNCVVIR